ncbi:MAG: hypothetical protein ABIP75_17825 [Pyrinomonadaceae bacterium]
MSEPNQPAPRRRFVIPLGRGSAGGGSSPAPMGDAGGGDLRARGRGGRKGGCLKIAGVLAVLAIIGVIGAAIGGYFYWRNYQQQPGYSVAVMFDAALQSDQKTFDEMVDTDKVSDGLADDAIAQAIKLYPGEITDQLRDQIRKAVKDFVPTIKDRAKKELLGEVGKKGDKLKGYPFVLMALMVPRVMTITQDGDTAKAIAPPEAGNTELMLKRNGERWRVVGVKDDAAVARILSSIAGDLPTPDILKGKLPPNLPKLPRNLPKIPGVNDALPHPN